MPEFVPAFLWLDPDPEKNIQGIQPRDHAKFEIAMARWKSIPPVRLLARHDSRTI